jgi:hypothetical protein
MKLWLIQQWHTLKGRYRIAALLLVAFLLLAFVLDFVLRVVVLRDASIRRFVPPPAASVATAPRADEVNKFIQSWSAPPPEAAATPVERKIVLQGVFGSRTDRSAAIALFAPEGGNPERVRAVKGQIVEGWTIERIDAERVILSRAGESQELLLFRRGDTQAKP